MKAKIAEIQNGRSGSALPADTILKHAVETYSEGQQPFSPRELIAKRNKLISLLGSLIPDAEIQQGQLKSLSKRKAAAGLMIYEPRPFQAENRVIIGAYCHSLILKASEIWMITSIEPGGTQSHLFERLYERADSNAFSISAVQSNASNVWAPLLWVRNKRILQNQAFIPHDFMTPWRNGLLFGNFEKIDLGEAAPLLAVVSTRGTEKSYLPDFYAEGKNRVWAFTSTFVGEAHLKPHQILIRDKLSAFVLAHKTAIDHFKDRWRVAAGSDNCYVDAITGVFNLAVPSKEQMDAALTALESIIDEPEWQEETAMSASNRARSRERALLQSQRD